MSDRLGRASSTASEESFLDGNAAAGVLLELFGTDVTAASARCDHCEDEGCLGQARWYDPTHGCVLTCSSCGGILLRVIDHHGRMRVDLRGLTYLEI